MSDLFDVGPREPIKPDSRATPARIGSGPAGETCGSCRFCVHVQWQAGWYFKCEKIKPNWSHGAGTDIRKKWAACKEWQGLEQ